MSGLYITTTSNPQFLYTTFFISHYVGALFQIAKMLKDLFYHVSDWIAQTNVNVVRAINTTRRGLK